MFEVSVIEPASSRRRRGLVVLLVLLLGLTAGVLLGRTWTTPAVTPAGEPAPSSSSSTTATSSTSPAPSSSATAGERGGPALCDRVKVAKFFKLTINGKSVDPSDPPVTTRHRALNEHLTGCRWEWPGKTLSLVVGPAPIPKPWLVIDAAWDTPAPYGCHEDMGGRAGGCTSIMWGAGSGSTRLAAWTNGDRDRQCVIQATGVRYDEDAHAKPDYELWDVCARLLTGKS